MKKPDYPKPETRAPYVAPHLVELGSVDSMTCANVGLLIDGAISPTTPTGS